MKNDLQENLKNLSMKMRMFVQPCAFPDEEKGQKGNLNTIIIQLYKLCPGEN